MTDTRRTRNLRLRWLVPAGTALAVGLAFAIPSAVASADTPDLPARTATELVTDVLSRDPAALSGSVVHTSRLGLPDLPAQGSSIGPVDLLTGSTTARVWFDGASSSRINLVGRSSEYSMVTKAGSDGAAAEAWTYASADTSVTHVVYTGDEPESVAPTSPDQAADRMLRQVEKDATVTVDRTATIAGRPCYQIVLTPTTADTLIGSIRIGIDAETSTPLRVQVWSDGDSSEPALETAFTEISFDAPDASVFDFVPPAGATVDEVEVPGDVEHDGTKDTAKDAVTTVGSGWSSIAILDGSSFDMGDAPVGDAAESGTEDLFDQFATEVDGGRAVTTNLVTVFLTDDGRTLVGAVPLSALQAAAR